MPDGAGQLRTGIHALCWRLSERLARKLMPVTPEQHRAVERMGTLIRRFHADLKA